MLIYFSLSRTKSNEREHLQSARRKEEQHVGRFMENLLCQMWPRGWNKAEELAASVCLPIKSSYVVCNLKASIG